MIPPSPKRQRGRGGTARALHPVPPGRRLALVGASGSAGFAGSPFSVPFSAADLTMLTLTLPDGSSRQFPDGTTSRQVAESIGKRLAKDAIAARLDGTIVDLAAELPAGEHRFAVLTEKDTDALEVLRHSSAHIMAR